MTTPYPSDLFSPSSRHMPIFAHQDDEIMYCGLIGRMPEAIRFLWVTNGDGLAPEVKMDPKEYAELRKTETDHVLETLGRPLSTRRCLDYSEIALYDRFIDIHQSPDKAQDLVQMYKPIGDDIYKEMKAFAPDAVWTCAFQNGHPEHDLTHIVTAYVIRQLEREGMKRPSFYHVPQYEYTILIPHRFHPLYKGAIHEIRLSPEEVALKRKALECYPSQIGLFHKFEKVINRLGVLGWLRGKPFSAEEYLARETFSAVDPQLDYTKSTHWFERANYMGDYCRETKVRFDTQIAVIARLLKDVQFG